MPSPRRFPPPWTIEEANNTCFIVRDSTGRALGYFYFEEEPAWRSADVRFEGRVQPVNATPLVVYRQEFQSPKSFAGVD